MSWSVNRWYKVSDVTGAVLEFEDFLHVELKNNNVRGFINGWECCITGLKEVPNELVLESIYHILV